jgi:flagellar biosynthesis GTPase FlhF
MKYRSLLVCLSILIVVFAGCSSSQQSAAEQARLEAEQAQVAEQARIAAEQAQVAQQALAAAEQAQAAAEKALAAAQQAKSAQQAKAAEEAKAKADEEQTKAAKAAAEQARAAEEARVAARRAKVDARQQSRAKAQTATLNAGTPINVITSSALSTQTVKAGDVFTMVLNDDVTEGGRVIVKRGASVRGVILDSDPGGRVKGVATMSLTLTTLTLADDNEVSVKTNEYNVEANSSVGKDVAKTGIGAGIGAAIGAIAGGARGAAIGAGIGGAAGVGTALATRGDPAVIAPETPITFNLTAPLTVTLPGR